MAINDIVQTIAEARVDARSLSEFMYEPADAMVSRRLAPSIHTLNYYLRFFDGAVSSVTADAKEIKEQLLSAQQQAQGTVSYIENTIRDAIDTTVIENSPVSDALVSVDGSLTQRTINKGLESIADLSTINNPKDGLRVYVKSYHAGLGEGGGYFTYESSKAAVNDFGLVVNGWVREDTSNITPDDFGILSNTEVDVSEKFQIMLDTCFSKNITVSTKKGSLYLVDDIVITGKSGFVFDCLGTLKRRDNLPATDTVPNVNKATSTIKFVECSDFKIPNITVDGNHINNNCRITRPYNDEYSQEWRHGVYLFQCKDVHIGRFYGHRASGDSIYIRGNDTRRVTVDYIYADSLDDNGDYIALGRNPLSIIGGKQIRIGDVVIRGVGHVSMPGGVDIEPNNGEYVEDVTVDSINCLSSGMNPLGVVSKYHEGEAIKKVYIKRAIVEAIPTTGSTRLVNFAGVTDLTIDYLHIKGTPTTYNLYAGVSGNQQPVKGLRIKYAEIDTCSLGFTADNLSDADINLVIKDSYSDVVKLYDVSDTKINLKANFHPESTDAVKVFYRLYGDAGDKIKNLTLSGDLSREFLPEEIGKFRAVVYGGDAEDLINVTLKDLDLTGWWVHDNIIVSANRGGDIRKINCLGLTEIPYATRDVKVTSRWVAGDYVKNSTPTVITDAVNGDYVVTGWTAMADSSTLTGAQLLEHKIVVGVPTVPVEPLP